MPLQLPLSLSGRGGASLEEEREVGLGRGGPRHRVDCRERGGRRGWVNLLMSWQTCLNNLILSYKMCTNTFSSQHANTTHTHTSLPLHLLCLCWLTLPHTLSSSLLSRRQLRSSLLHHGGQVDVHILSRAVVPKEERSNVVENGSPSVLLLLTEVPRLLEDGTLRRGVLG